MCYFPNRAIEEQESFALRPTDRTYPSRRETLTYYREDLSERLERLERMRPHDWLHPDFDRFFYATGRYRYFEVLRAPRATVQDCLAAIAEVDELLRQTDEADEAAVAEESPILRGQAVLVDFLPMYSFCVPAYIG